MSDDESDMDVSLLPPNNLIPRRFEIPTRDEDLTVDNIGQYVVRDGDMDADHCKADLKVYINKLEETNDWLSIKDHFDTFFSIAKYNSAIDDWQLRIDAVSHLINSLERVLTGPLPDAVGNVLHSDGKPPDEILEECALVSDALLMIVYLLYRLVCHFETELLRRERVSGKKGRKAAELDDEMTIWIKQRQRILKLFTRICEFCCADRESKTRQGAVKYLWRPPEADKGMIRAFIETIFKFVEHPDNVRATHRAWLVDVFRLVRLICIKFDYFHRLAGGLVEKTIHLDFMRETTLNHYPFIDAIIGAAKDNDMDPLLSHMVHYVGGLGAVDFGKTSPKPYALFLQTMAERAPQVMVKHLTSVVTYLENDPSTLRSAVLSAFAEIICSDVLSDENCQQFSRLLKARDKMLDKLMDHLADQNAPVRARAVNLWVKLADRQKIPLDRLKKGVITKIGQRLLDKSVNVRKAAVHFMSAFLVKNPYGHDFSYDLHSSELTRLLKRREALEKRNPEYEGVEGAERMFSESKEQISLYVTEWVEKFMAGTAELLDFGLTDPALLLGAVTGQLMFKTENSVRIFVQLVFSGHVKDVQPKSDCEAGELSMVMMEQLKEMFIRDRVATHIQDDEELLESEEKREDYENSVRKLDHSIDWLKNKLIVELEMEDCVPIALRAVIHGELAEMKEGIKFVVECKNFMIRGADKAVRSLCSLIWRNNADIRKEVLEAASKMFMSTHKDAMIQHKSTATNLMSVVEGMGDEERGCVEEVICQMAVDSIPPGVLKNIWNVIHTATGENREKRRMIGLRLMTILARADKEGLRGRLRAFQGIIRDEKNPVEMRTEAAVAIANLASERKRSDLMQEVFRLPFKDSLFSTLENFALEELLRPSDDPSLSTWFHLISTILSIHFDMAADTCQVVGSLVAKCLWYTRRVTEWVLFYENECKREEEDEMKRSFLNQRRSYWTQHWLHVNERMLALSGEVALRCVVHADVTYQREIKRLAEIIRLVKKGDLKCDAGADRPLKDWEWRSAMRKGIFDYASASEKDGANAGHEANNAEDDEELRVRSRSEALVNQKLFRPGRLLSRLLPHVVYCLRAESSPLILRNAAALAFSKFLLVSTDLSWRGAPLFFCLLNKAPSAALRGNLMVATGDLCFRNPNMVEDYAADVYSLTKDEDARVRETALLVLTHLTMNQMTKMRGSIADIARCILDEAPSIQSLTKEFFNELSTRGSVVYNMMPDFVSRLSKNSKEVSLGEFKHIMHYLVSLLKDKHGEAFLAKLVLRFEHAKGGRAVANNKELPFYYSYCVSQFQATDKSFLKIRDALPAYAPFLEDKRILDDFLACIQPLIKNTKSVDMKADVEEFEAQLRAIHEKGIRTGDLNGVARRQEEKKALKADRARQTPRRGRGGPGRGGRPTRRTVVSSSEEEVAFSDSD